MNQASLTALAVVSLGKRKEVVPITRYGVTGPSKITFEQKGLVRAVILDLTDPSEITNGGAFGVDTTAAKAAFDAFYDDKGVLLRGCFPKDKWYNTLTRQWVNVREDVEGGYLRRNDRIVFHSDVLVAFTMTPREELRSGEWSTVRRAHKAGIEVMFHPFNK